MLTKMEHKFQFLNKTGQRGVPTKCFGTPGQQVEKQYCPVQNGTLVILLYATLHKMPGKSATHFVYF